MAYLLSELGVAPEARFVWSFGADSGKFGGIECGQYIKDLPLSRATSDVLLAYEMNEVALLPEHGFPVRLVVPGFYGTNSVKWLRKLELHVERAQSPFTKRWYNDPDPSGSGTRPVWEVAPQSVIVRPKPDAEVKAGEVVVWGWAWADGGVSSVELSGDDGHQALPSPRQTEVRTVPPASRHLPRAEAVHLSSVREWCASRLFGRSA
jgi:DMSO/TMAO reductase YedYZ molybdopterin-dependent catalytic subunit